MVIYIFPPRTFRPISGQKDSKKVIHTGKLHGWKKKHMDRQTESIHQVKNECRRLHTGEDTEEERRKEKVQGIGFRRRGLIVEVITNRKGILPK